MDEVLDSFLIFWVGSHTLVHPFDQLVHFDGFLRVLVIFGGFLLTLLLFLILQFDLFV